MALKILARYQYPKLMKLYQYCCHKVRKNHVAAKLEGPGDVEFAVDEDVGTGGVQVDSETPVPLEKVDDALPPVLLKLG
ncbi:uncharacterized protein J4E79_003204 [Alternaria viburni]|uniref:uncharacterized protein n=1 Tax=Alternaria viburni TaxID=566460 RepID=UPI0020C2C3CB|nr:uncharacterized protein J4E79_003204 [Alternaria viburni]KAI4664905.1 hypothetical protein J4E79_003204 [Alternaria viburni]